LLYSLIGLPLLRRAGHFGAVAAGLLFGSMAILGMRWPIEIALGQSIDSRNLIVLAAGAFGGPWTAAVCALAVIAYRIVTAAPDILNSIAAIMAAALLGTALYLRWWRRARIGGPANSWRWVLCWPASACPGTSSSADWISIPPCSC
jgi:hypothetical protein